MELQSCGVRLQRCIALSGGQDFQARPGGETAIQRYDRRYSHFHDSRPEPSIARVMKGEGEPGIWVSFKADRPGERFVRLRERRQSKRTGGCMGEKCVNILGGSLLVILGLLMIPAPGPGVLTIGIGMALLGTEFLVIARCMDAAESKGRAQLAEIRDRWFTIRSRQRESIAVGSAQG